MKLNQLKEQMDTFDTDIKRVAKLTDVNDHNGSVIAGLKILGTDRLVSDLVAKMEKVAADHKKEGHMSPNLRAERKKVYDKMMSIAKKRLDARQYKKFHGAF